VAEPNAAEPGVPALPTTFRPRWARRVIYPVMACLLAAMGYLALALPGGGAAGFRAGDRIAILLVAVAVAYVLQRIAAVRVEADELGLTVVNIVRRRRLEWAEVLGVRLAVGDPWLVLDLADGTSIAVMGVQGSDGEYARGQARRLARLVVEQTRTERND
jgi:hypothetical protein